jgi:hypothetical protein
LSPSSQIAKTGGYNKVPTDYISSCLQKDTGSSTPTRGAEPIVLNPTLLLESHNKFKLQSFVKQVALHIMALPFK